jgi:hypothetical protein
MAPGKKDSEESRHWKSKPGRVHCYLVRAVPFSIILGLQMSCLHTKAHGGTSTGSFKFPRISSSTLEEPGYFALLGEVF